MAYVVKIITLRDEGMVEEVGEEAELLRLVAGTDVRAPQWRQTVWMREHVGLVMTCAHRCLHLLLTCSWHTACPAAPEACALATRQLNHIYMYVTNSLTCSCLRAHFSTAKDLHTCKCQPLHLPSTQILRHS